MKGFLDYFLNSTFRKFCCVCVLLREIFSDIIQSPLGFATRDKAAALALATSKAVTDLRQYINSDLGFSDLEICFLCTK